MTEQSTGPSTGPPTGPSTGPPTAPSAAPSAGPAVGPQTVEQVVRGQLSKALGGVRGMLEAAVPTIAFTILFISTHNLQLALAVSVVTALGLLAARLLSRSTVQFVVNSLFGIAVGAFFAWRSARSGGDANEQALAYFLPGLIYNTAYAGLMTFSNLVRWPVVGFMVGSVAGDATAWHRDPQVVRLCRNLTWMLAAPCALRVAVQLPMYLAGRAAEDAGPMVAALAVSKIAMGWPLQVAALAGMVWLLARNATPVQPERADPA